jgi:NTP pyrophosphatase (non-canonical NTP hydrolase)
VSEFEDVGSLIERFAAARDWQQFHTPKNLAMALAGEVGELVAELQWVPDPGPEPWLEDGLRARLGDEVADVLIYVIRFSQVCGIDVLSEVRAKLERNEARYPVERSKGSSAKYTDLPPP